MQYDIDVQGLEKSYGENKVLQGVSFKLRKGETFALLGVNGAGKTTTIECIEGLRKPDKGKISVCGYQVDQELAALQKVLGVQLQSTSLNETMTVKEAMQLFCAWHKTPFRHDLLVRFDMAGEYLNQTYASLSTGRKRRLHLALALCHSPQLVILDEPTAGLDVEGRHTLHAELKKLKAEGMSILLATHDMAEAEALCDTIAILRNGVIAKQGSPRELTANADIQSRVIIKTQKGSLLHNALPSVIAPDRLEQDYLSYGCKNSAELLLILLTHIQKWEDTVTDLRVERASIEDIFLSVAGGQ